MARAPSPRWLLLAAPLLAAATKSDQPLLIADGRIGKLELGKPIPVALLGAHPERLYATSFYADAQPLEGFALVDPPLLAVVAGGPFARWGAANPGEQAPARVRKQAAALARAGKLRISMLVVTSPKLRTATGIGVGSRWDELRKAHPAASLRLLPALWEEPTCVAQQKTIWFFFRGCRTAQGKVALADDATVTRVVVRAAS
jgi:hypothetical protein